MFYSILDKVKKVLIKNFHNTPPEESARLCEERLRSKLASHENLFPILGLVVTDYSLSIVMPLAVCSLEDIYINIVSPSMNGGVTLPSLETWASRVLLAKQIAMGVCHLHEADRYMGRLCPEHIVFFENKWMLEGYYHTTNL